MLLHSAAEAGGRTHSISCWLGNNGAAAVQAAAASGGHSSSGVPDGGGHGRPPCALPPRCEYCRDEYDLPVVAAALVHNTHAPAIHPHLRVPVGTPTPSHALQASEKTILPVLHLGEERARPEAVCRPQGILRALRALAAHKRRSATHPTCLVLHTAGQERSWPEDCPSHVAYSGAREASAYIRFIVEHWDCLPDNTLFLHGHECASCCALSAMEQLYRYRPARPHAFWSQSHSHPMHAQAWRQCVLSK